VITRGPTARATNRRCRCIALLLCRAGAKRAGIALCTAIAAPPRSARRRGSAASIRASRPARHRDVAGDVPGDLIGAGAGIGCKLLDQIESDLTVAPANHDVFFSYQSGDHAAVETVARRLAAAGLRVFLDRWYLTVGQPWPQALEAALGSCGAVAVFLGGAGMGKWQQREQYLALDRQTRDEGFPVIPVLLPGADPPLGFLSLGTWVDLRDGVDDEGLLARGSHLPGGRGIGHRLPPRSDEEGGRTGHEGARHDQGVDGERAG
jgi:hypothetical protein